MKAVFDTKGESDYDDDIAHRYHFPPRYLDLVKETVGDWAVFRQPRDGGGSKAYFAIGRVVGIEPDHSSPSYSYALIEDFQNFDNPVPWRAGGRYAERALREITNVPQVGLFLRGKSVRRLEDDDFTEMTLEGFATSIKTDIVEAENLEWAKLQIVERKIVEVLVTRRVRDARFSRVVRNQYGHQCAVTHTALFDHAGVPEVQGAHIWPVEFGGPDIVQNGIALSGTIHWMFDHHLISFDEQYRLLVSDRTPPGIKDVIKPGRRMLLPDDQRAWPSQTYLARHRARFFELNGLVE